MSATAMAPVRTDAAPTYLPSLDGMRAVSIALVLLSHSGLDRFVPGGLGVMVFFVISGFLITRQIAAEIDRTATLSLRQFYTRRVLRLAPALLVFLALATPIALAAGIAVSAADVASSLLYAANYDAIYHGYPANSPYLILWSLAIEEHFYIVFPVFLLLFRRDLRRAIVPLVVAAGLVLLWRAYLNQACGPGADWALCGLPDVPGAPYMRRVYLATDTRFDSILFGCLLALASRYHRALANKLLLGAVPFWGAAALLLASLVVRDPTFRNTLRYSLQPLCITMLMANVLCGNQGWMRALLSRPPVVHLGRLSYSLYLYHWGVLVVIAQLGGTIDFGHAEYYLFLPLSLLLASASYRFVERPLVKWRRRWGSHSVEAA